MKKFNSIILSLLLLVNITSCGYQFRGATDVNFVSISIDGGSPSFLKILKKQFKQSGVKVQERNSEKTLEITNDTFSKKILSLSAAGKVREYQINYKISFRFKSQDGEWGNSIDLEANRDYTYDDKNIIAKTEEESRLIKGMQEQLIRTIVNQISVRK
jgi:LPS-assembly lipoprotein